VPLRETINQQVKPMNKRYANTSSVPLSLAVFLATDNYDYNDDPYTISATTLLKPTRQIVLSQRVPANSVTLDLVAQMNTRMGSAVHDAIERSWKDNYKNALEAIGIPKFVINKVRINPTNAELAADPDIIPVYMEQRMQRNIGKWTVSGKFDFIGEGRVQDFKTATIWSYMNQVNAWKQMMQGSLYRWLDPNKITQDQMDIIHIFKDWMPAMVATDPNYPKQPFAVQTFNLLPYDETDRFVSVKLAEIERCMDADDADIPDCGEDDLWRSKTVYKYYANGFAGAKKSSKNFEDLASANQHMYTEKGGKGEVVTVYGTVKACNHCAAAPVCGQRERLIASGHLLKQI
jgi:hypothetical protein